MKFGLLSAILDTYTFEQVIDFAAENGFAAVELACWPREKAARRYAGVTHINADDADIDHIKSYCAERNVEISALAYYPNPLDPDEEKRNYYISHIKKLILTAEKLGVGLVNTFIGRDQHKTVEENLAMVKDIWSPILAFAREHHVKIAIENCPMLFSENEWPGGQNIMTTPDNWRRVFELFPGDDTLGLNFDPSHFIWQMMDYVSVVDEFKDRIYHAHFKDIKLHRDRLDRVGTMAVPLKFMSPVIPSRGDVDWKAFIDALNAAGFNGTATLEIEDRDYEGSEEKVIESIRVARDYLKKFL